MFYDDKGNLIQNCKCLFLVNCFEYFIGVIHERFLFLGHHHQLPEEYYLDVYFGPTELLISFIFRYCACCLKRNSHVPILHSNRQTNMPSSVVLFGYYGLYVSILKFEFRKTQGRNRIHINYYTPAYSMSMGVHGHVC